MTSNKDNLDLEPSWINRQIRMLCQQMSLLNVNDKAYYGQSRSHRQSTKQYCCKMLAAGPRTTIRCFLI